MCIRDRGDPLLRDPEVVRTDVLRGLVSKEKAANSYGVVLTEDVTINMEATIAKRKELELLRGQLQPFNFGAVLEKV